MFVADILNHLSQLLRSALKAGSCVSQVFGYVLLVTVSFIRRGYVIILAWSKLVDGE